MKYCCTILILTFLFQLKSFGQFNSKADSLSYLCNNAHTDAEKVKAYGELAELYFIYQLDRAGDSVLQKQLKVAEFSGNKNLILSALFGNAITNLTNWRSKESFDKALLFLQRGRDYAKAIGSEEYLTLAYVRLSALYRKRGQADNAFNNANIATTTSLNIESDSIRIVAAIELGDAYQARGESLLAYKAYTNALENAESIDDIPLQSEAYHRFSDLYQSLNNKEESREYLLKSLALNKKTQNIEGLIKDNIDLARYTDEKVYLDVALHLADSLQSDKYRLQAKKVMYGYYAFIVANSDSTINYINNNQDLKLFFQNRGLSSYYFTIGTIYKLAAKFDSAIHYLKLGEPGLDSAFDIKTRQSVYVQIGDCYRQLSQYNEAITYYEKAYSYKDIIKDPASELSYSSALSSLYEKTGDYKKSIFFLRNSVSLNDSLGKLANQKDIALAEVNNEKKIHEKELEKIENRKLAKRNLQYMAITIVITFLFILMLVLGMFPVSKLTIKLCGYFVFICLFEFIVLLIDSWLHHLAHGEPLKIWLMKIVLIALLVPFQHFLEHGMIKFIESRKLHELRKKLVPKKRRQQLKIDADTIDEIENDTAVL